MTWNLLVLVGCIKTIDAFSILNCLLLNSSWGSFGFYRKSTKYGFLNVNLHNVVIPG